VVTASTPIITRPYYPRSAATDWANRLGRCIFGLALFGAGIAMVLHAELGAAPWDMLHQGVSDQLGISVGVVIEIVAFLLLLLWIPLRQRVGIGTILNAIEIGLVFDLVEPRLPDTDLLVPRALFVLGGILSVAIGSGLYIGAGLGTGPRDGIMVGLSQRGISVRLARTLIELSVGIIGIALGAGPGIGTIAFMFGIGPLVQLALPKLALPPRSRGRAAIVPLAAGASASGARPRAG
jgi:uncharacterized membrane protein YczE